MADPLNDEFSAADWERLRELRERFLEPKNSEAAANDYWLNARDFELYDATFARRIRWKWDAVLAELALRGVAIEPESVVDWGCGTGIASRAFCAAFPGAERVHLCDRSKHATWFARAAWVAEHGEADLSLREPAQDEPIDALLASHVLGELDAVGLEALLALASRARVVVWVEAGTREIARRLSGLRGELLERFDVLAPCTHRSECGALKRESDWCHFFARPPAEVFTSPFWSRFSAELSIDLRALPYTFLALERRGDRDPNAPGAARLVGRPRRLKGRALLDVCDASGVRELALLERTDKAMFKRLDRAGEVSVVDVDADGERIQRIAPRFGPSTAGS